MDAEALRASVGEVRVRNGHRQIAIGALSGLAAFALVVWVLDPGALCLPSDPAMCSVDSGIPGLYWTTTDPNVTARVLYGGLSSSRSWRLRRAS